ncbi:MAG: hypothetical protein HQ592_15460, partial [Planctomycetes bacterium]|nr:hypothetical protein [Planctomycetota bacterium]
ALVLALAGGIGLGNADAPEGQSADKPGSEKPDEISAAWAQLRTVWREIDAYSSMKEKGFLKETEEKRARHTDAMGTLVAAGALPKPVGDILQTSFTSSVSSASERLPVKWESIRPSCYEMTAVGAAGLRAQGQLAKSAMHLAGLEASGKLSPAVVEKTRKQIARDMRMIMYAKVRPKHVDVSALLKAHFDGEEFEIPVEVEQAADMLMQLLTSDEPPVVVSPSNTKTLLAAHPKICAALRKLWLEIDEYPDLIDYKKVDELRKAKVADHEKVLGEFAVAGLIDDKPLIILRSAFNSASRSTQFRRGMVECYEMTAVGSAGVRAEGQLVKASASLGELAASGKLSPQVAEKVRKQIGRDLQVIASVGKWNDPAVQKMGEAYMAGKEIDEPVPEEFAKAAEVLAQIMATTE